MKLNVTSIKQWNDWMNKLDGAIKPFVYISNVFRKSSMTRNELFATADSTLQFNSPDSFDLELKSYAVEYLDFLDEKNQLHCRKVLKNASESFDIEPLLFECCNLCFNNVKQGKANHNKNMKSILYCPNCGKQYTMIFMFSRIELGLKRTKPKYFGDGNPVCFKAHILHSEIVKLFPSFFDHVERDVKISEELIDILKNEMMVIFSQKLDVSIKKLRNDTEEFSSLSEDLYLIKDVKFSD